MTEFTRINAARPGKIIAMLDVIAASARSNKATPDEVATLLAPVRECLGDFADAAAPAPGALAAPAARAEPITSHDGVLLGIIGRTLKDHSPDEIRAALAWVVAHKKTGGQ